MAGFKETKFDDRLATQQKARAAMLEKARLRAEEARRKLEETADERKAIQDSAFAARDFERKDTREASAKAIDFLKSKGMQVTVVSDKEIGRMQETTRQAMYKFANDGHAKLIKDLQAELEKHRK